MRRGGFGLNPEDDILADQRTKHILHLSARLRTKVEHPWLQHLVATEGEQLIRQSRTALAGLLDFLGMATQRAVGREVAEEQIAVA